jgi:hypothetical protein
MLLFYEDLMSAWQSEVGRLGSLIGTRAYDISAVRESMAEFVDEELWHHRSSLEDLIDDRDVSMPAKATYLALRLAHGTLPSRDALDLIACLAEYGLEPNPEESRSDAEKRSQMRLQAAEREARAAWQHLREHRALLVKLLSQATASNGRNVDRGTHDEYVHLVSSVKERAKKLITPGATAIVVSKGDEDLLDLPGITGWHFPRDEDGTYAGYHPASSEDVVAHLQHLRRKGAHFMVLPSPYLWWLDHYAGLRKYVEKHARLVGADESCRIYKFID